MDESMLAAIMNSSVSLAIAEMTDEEVLAQRLAILLGTDPRSRLGYEKIDYLYTERDGTKMHSETARAFLSVTGQRLGI